MLELALKVCLKTQNILISMFQFLLLLLLLLLLLFCLYSVQFMGMFSPLYKIVL